MSKRKKNRDVGLVYSTHSFEQDEDEWEDTLPKEEQQLVVRREKKGRGGKTVTLIEGFDGTDDDLKDLGKKLKSHCGTGGSVKDGVILIQGDQSQKIYNYLDTDGYGVRKAN
jgi:translation initiation factor 1